MKWQTCCDWVLKHAKQTKNLEHAQLAKETNLLLLFLPWGMNKLTGLSDAQEIHTLWRFLGDYWLSCSQQNELLRLLEEKVVSNTTLLRKYHIEGVDFTVKVLDAFKVLSDCMEDYKMSPSWVWL